MVKRKHYKCLKYIDYIPDIIANPDYVGINPNESENSIEIVKQYDESKVLRRLHSGRLKRFNVDKEEKNSIV